MNSNSIIVPCPMCKTGVEIGNLIVSYEGQKDWILRRASVISRGPVGRCPNCSSTVEIEEGRLEIVIRR